MDRGPAHVRFQGLKNSAKAILQTGLHRLGAIRMVRAQHARKLRVLTYHHFDAEADSLRWQCAHIRKYYSPVSMAEVAGALTGNQRFPPNAVAVTVDDGYRDFLVYGLPIFRTFGITPTIFLVSGFIDRNCWLWWDQIEYAIENATESRIEAGIGGHLHRMPMTTPDEKRQALHSILEALKTVSIAERKRVSEEIPQSLGVTLPKNPPPHRAPLTWDEVRTLPTLGAEVGAHTRTHPILSTIEDVEQLEDEIAGSKRRIEQELGAAVFHFCYPNGRWQDIGPDALACTRKSGFHTAVTTEAGMNCLSEADPFRLRRLSVDPGVPPVYFTELLAGFRSS